MVLLAASLGPATSHPVGAQADESSPTAASPTFVSKNAGKVPPSFTISAGGKTYANKNKNYVVSRDGALWEGDKRLRFVGYDSPNYAFLEDPNWHAIDPFEIEDLIKTVAQSHSKVVRVYSMGFQIQSSYKGNVPYTENGASITQAPKHIGWDPSAPRAESVNPAPASYTQGDYYLYEPVWKKVDYFLAMADRYGVRVDFPFVNEWDWFGGRGAFANYYGINSSGSNFYGTNASSLFMGEMYDRLTGMIMNRTNTVTGIKYKQDPAVMAWETSNEFTGADSQWTIDRGIYLHDTVGINQLFMDGTYTTGAQGASQMNAYRVRAASPYIDVLNDHFYASGVPNFVAGMVPLASIAKENAKAYVVGEYGLTSAIEMDHLLRAVIDYDVDGAMVWSLRYRDARGGYYWHRDDQSNYNINFNSYHWPGFAENSEFQEDQVVDTIYDYSYAIDGRTAPPMPVPDTAPLLFDISSPTVINWRGTTGANAYLVERATSKNGPWQVIGRDLSDSMSVVRDGPLFRDVTTRAHGKYYYRVKGYNTRNRSGFSPYSNVVGPVSGATRSFGANVVGALDPGFEATGVIAPWDGASTASGLSFRAGGADPNVGTAASSTEASHSGTESAKLTGAGELWLRFPVTPRNTYVASFWLKTNRTDTKFTLLSRKNNAGVGNGFGDTDPYQYRGPGPSNANNLLAFSDYSDRTLLPNVDKEFSNSISDIVTNADGDWHYYTIQFDGGDLDISKGVTEANLLISNRASDSVVYVDDVNVHETLLANSSFSAWGGRWTTEAPWDMKSKTTSNNASLTALLPVVAGTGAELSQQVRVAQSRDYSLTFFAQGSSPGVKYAILDDRGRFLVRPTAVPTSTDFVPHAVTFSTGRSDSVRVAFYDAVASAGSFRVDEVDVVLAKNATYVAPAVASALTESFGKGWSPVPGGGASIKSGPRVGKYRATSAVTPDTDYLVGFQASDENDGQRFYVTDGTTNSKVFTTTPGGRADDYAVPFRTGPTATQLTLVVVDTARSGHHSVTGVEFSTSAIATLDPAALEDGESTYGAQNLFGAGWDTRNARARLDLRGGNAGMYGVRVDYRRSSKLTKVFASPVDLSSFDGVSMWLSSHGRTGGRLTVKLTDAAGGTTSGSTRLDRADGTVFFPFPAAGFDPSVIAKVELTADPRGSGSFEFDSLRGSSPYLVENGEGGSAWYRPMSRPGENPTNGRTASATILTGTDPVAGVDGGSARSVTYSYNTGTNRGIKVFSQIVRELAPVDWSDRDALRLWVKPGTATAGADTKVAVRVSLADGTYGEQTFLVSSVAADGTTLTLPFRGFTTYPTGRRFSTHRAAVVGVSLVFSQNGRLVANVPTAGNTTIGSPVVDNVMFVDEIRAVAE